MEITHTQPEILKISGTLDAFSVEDLHQAFTAFVQQPGDLVLDVSDVERCDTAALQLLCSLYRTAQQLCKPLRIEGTSEAIAESARALGIPAQEFDSATAEKEIAI